MRFLPHDDLLTSRPSLHTGIARNFSESAFPGLWRGLKGLWCPSVGIQGRQLIDFSGYGHTGVFSSGMGMDAWTPSPYGWALKYDGVNDCVNLGTGIVDLNGEFTILFRARLDDILTDTYVGVGCSNNVNTATTGYMMFIHKTGKGGYVLQYDEGAPAAAYSTSPNKAAIADRWYTLVMRRTPSGILMFQDDYVTISDGTNPTFLTSTTQNWGIGTYDPVNVSVLFKGQIGDVMIWDRGLAPREMELVSQGFAHPLTLAEKYTFGPPHASGSVSTAGGMMLLGVGG